MRKIINIITVSLIFICLNPFTKAQISDDDNLNKLSKIYDLKPNGYFIKNYIYSPFATQIECTFGLPKKSKVNINVLDVYMKDTLNCIFTGELECGIFSVKWNKLDKIDNQVKPGYYYLILEANSCSQGKEPIMYFLGKAGLLVFD